MNAPILPLSRKTLSRALACAWYLDAQVLPDLFAVFCNCAGLAVDRFHRDRLPDATAERLGVLRSALQIPETRTQLRPAMLLPDWLQDELAEPQCIDQLVPWFQRRPPLWLRVQRTDPGPAARELADAGLQVTAHPFIASALCAERARVNLHTVPAYREGRVEIQDLAAQAVGHFCAPRPGQRWWDTCAGGGGKALLLAELMGNTGNIVATDLRTYKLDDLRKRARRAGFNNIRCRQWKGKPLDPRRGTFDGVLVDAPCSCSGTWRRNPDARWRTDCGQVTALTALQLRLLKAAATGVKSGGRLVYSTCSVCNRENAGVIEQFLRETPGFTLEPAENPLTRTPTNGCLEIRPWDGNCDAMFAARMQRRD